jgi:hypothetical protein
MFWDVGIDSNGALRDEAPRIRRGSDSPIIPAAHQEQTCV